MPLRSTAPLSLLVLLVFASGGAALVFQVAWMRELRLVFGATTAAVAAVLAIFMAGLGVGSAVLGKWADRAANPLRMYGLLEMGIAICVAATPWLISLAGAIYIGLGGHGALGLTGATAVRLVLAAAVMAVPTFLMGGTLPAIVRAATTGADTRRRALGVLYGSNTLGAVFGVYIATFFALEHLGTRATLWAGCALGLLAGAIATAKSRALAPLATHSDDSSGKSLDTPYDEESGNSHQGDAELRAGLIYMTAAVLGFTFFALEMVWYRMLAPILGGTTFTFGLILCVALFGIGVGGIAYHVVFRWLRPSWTALAVTCGCEAALAIAPFAMGDRLAVLAAARSQSADNFTQLVIGWSHVVGIVVLPVALVSGLQFPLLIALLGRGRQTVSRHLGMTYAWNTLGAITGSLVAGFGAMPLLGATGMWRAIAVILMILSFAVLVIGTRIAARGALAVAALATVTIAALFAEGPTAAWRHSGVGAGRSFIAVSDPNRVRQWRNEERHTLAWEVDGIESSVGIDAQDGVAFVVNGKIDGNSLTDGGTQIGMAILGAALHDDPKTALVIGLGTGESAGWLAEMRAIERVDVVELEPAIDEVARRCSDVNWNVLEHPRVRRIYNDGREFMLTTDEKYDLIVSEPSNPYRAGIAVLYTTEFYEAVRQRLKPGGLFIQWLQAYEVNEWIVTTVLVTAQAAFPHVELWQTLPLDLQLVCSNTPLAYSPDELRQRISSGTLKEALDKAWNVYDLEGFLAHFVANAKWVDEIAKAPFLARNTDDRTVLEYSFAKTVGLQNAFATEEIRGRMPGTTFLRPTLIGDMPIDWTLVELRRQEANLLQNGQFSLAFLPTPEHRAIMDAFEYYRSADYAATLDEWPDDFKPASPIQTLVLAHSHAELGQPECLELIDAAEPQFPVEAAAMRVIYHARAAHHGEAIRAQEQLVERLEKTPWVVRRIAESAIARAIDVAKAEPSLAPKLFALLSRPFASGCLEYRRALSRAQVATKLGPEQVVEAFSVFEPHVPWAEDFLAARSKAYAEVNHPLAGQAERDLQWFKRHQPPK